LIEAGSFRAHIWQSGTKLVRNSLLPTSPYSSYMRAIEVALEMGKNKHEDPQLVAMLIADLCMRKELGKLRYLIGKGIKFILFFKNFITWNTWEKIFFKRLGK